MPLKSHRRTEARTSNYHYDSDYSVPSDRELAEAARVATRRAAARKTPPQSQVDPMSVGKSPPLLGVLRDLDNVKRKRKADTSSVTSSVASLYPIDQEDRLSAGGKNSETLFNEVTSFDIKKLKLPKSCKKARVPCEVPKLPQPPPLNIIDLKLSDSKVRTDMYYADCYEPPPPPLPRRQTRGCQTLYRESSAQTLPYLPNVANKENELEDLEIFKLSKIIPGDGPPGIYEVEILERARKRWAFAKALKTQFKEQLEKAKEHARQNKHKHILAAFEWEHWIEREEHIQECQMMRLEIVIRMFDKREREMHNASKQRIEQSCEVIEARRQAALHKNEVEFGRQMRRLEIKRLKLPRNWRKENIVSQLGNPSSEFYAPQQRFGVSAGRRHFVPSTRKAFEARIDDLEKVVPKGTAKLVCPFAKLKKWSTPKQRFTEVEQNFCTDENLEKMYNSLTGLRKQSQKQKVTPKCLRNKHPDTFESSRSLKRSTVHVPANLDEDYGPAKVKVEKEEEVVEVIDEKFRAEVIEHKRRTKYLMEEQEREEVEAMLLAYEGTTIGWLLRFLSEEMGRLQEQRILHFITMLAQKERWRREAAEAGLRQKENEMREIYEQLYYETNDTHAESADEYLQKIFDIDVPDYAEYDATHQIKSLAKVIDNDINRWLQSLQSVQTPLNFDELRCTLKELIFPDITEIIAKRELDAIISYILNDVLFANVFQLLEPFDIGWSLANEIVDRTIDTDLYYFSSECVSLCSCQFCMCSEPRKEIKSILRKAIRYAVPGRRWKTENERIAYEAVRDILDEAFQQMPAVITPPCKPVPEKCCALTPKASYTNLFYPVSGELPSSSDSATSFIKTEDVSDVRLVHSIISRLSAFRYSQMLQQADAGAMELPEGEQEHQTVTRTLLNTIIRDIIKELPSESSSDVMEKDEDIPQNVLETLLTKVCSPEVYIDDPGVDLEALLNAKRAVSEDNRQYKLEANESTTELIQETICLLTDPAERQERFKNLIREGKITIISRESAMADSDEAVSDVESFMYDSGGESVRGGGAFDTVTGHSVSIHTSGEDSEYGPKEPKSETSPITDATRTRSIVHFEPGKEGEKVEPTATATEGEQAAEQSSPIAEPTAESQPEQAETGEQQVPQTAAEETAPAETIEMAPPTEEKPPEADTEQAPPAETQPEQTAPESPAPTEEPAAEPPAESKPEEAAPESSPPVPEPPAETQPEEAAPESSSPVPEPPAETQPEEAAPESPPPAAEPPAETQPEEAAPESPPPATEPPAETQPEEAAPESPPPAAEPAAEAPSENPEPADAPAENAATEETKTENPE